MTLLLFINDNISCHSPGLKNENTLGALKASCQIDSSKLLRRIRSPEIAFVSYSIALINLVNLSSGSTKEPKVGSASRTTDLASSSSRIAATVASKLP